MEKAWEVFKINVMSTKYPFVLKRQIRKRLYFIFFASASKNMNVSTPILFLKLSTVIPEL